MNERTGELRRRRGGCDSGEVQAVRSFSVAQRVGELAPKAGYDEATLDVVRTEGEIRLAGKVPWRTDSAAVGATRPRIARKT